MKRYICSLSNYTNRFSKGVVCTVLVFALLSYELCIPVSGDTMNLKCKSYILVDASTGEIILEKNSHDKLPPASVTKIMTMLLIIEALDSGKIKIDDKVTISKQAESRSTEGTMLLLEAGEIRTVEDLLYGIAVESANDACIAMAEYIAGSTEEFVKLMNNKAAELGMNDTTFLNTNGLHIDGHVTSAHDIALMSKELIKHEKIFNYIAKYMVTVNVGKNNDVKRELVNKNKMVRFYKDVDGIKTGFTNQAMYCISVTAKKNNLRLISVIMGAPDTKTRNADARKLLDYGFANYSNYIIAKKGDIIADIPVSKGNTESIKAITEEDISILIKKGEDKNITKEINIPDIIAAPLKKGQQVGEIIILKDSKEIVRYPLICDSDVTKSSFINNLKRVFDYWFRSK